MTATTTVPTVGSQLEVREHKPLTRTDIVRYAGASGDFNPIHHDETFATRVGFPTVFSIGMYQAALLANHAADAFGPDNLRRVTLRFSAQVWPGDVLTCTGTVKRVEETGDGTEVEADLVCTRRGEDGSEGVAITGSAAFLLP
jgi:acyl dehydratase